MSRRLHICEDGEIIYPNKSMNDEHIELIIPTNVEIYNNCRYLKVKKLQVYGYEFDMRYTKNNCLTLPTGHLTEKFWQEYIKEIESIIPFLGGGAIEIEDWF